MTARNIIWLPVVRDKLLDFRGFRFTDEETHDFIAQLILEIEDQLTSSFITKHIQKSMVDIRVSQELL